MHMRKIARMAAVASAATIMVLSAGTAHASGPDITDRNAGGRSEFKTYGDHLYIYDTRADGHSVVTIVEQGTPEYHWNRWGEPNMVHKNLNLRENVTMYIRTCLADWKGSATAGILWETCSTGKQTEA